MRERRNIACAVEVDGDARCWGDDTFGQVAAPGEQFKQISTSGDTSCGVTLEGRVLCWGWDAWDDEMSEWDGPPNPTYGDFGEWCGSYAEEAYIDISVLGDEEYTYVAAGSTPCAVRADGKIVCWGDNCHGEAVVPPGFGAE